MMHSVSIDRNVSPRKRTLSRGMSEDESLRTIITEQTECPSRRLARSESRNSMTKKKSESQDLYTTDVTDMVDLQATYDEAVQELRGLEVERETLVFQVDLLRDTLGSVEELLAEAQREAREASLELEQERAAKRRLEAVVRSLMQDVESLKEERNTASSVGWECSEQDTSAAGGEPAPTSAVMSSPMTGQRHGGGEPSGGDSMSQVPRHRHDDPEPEIAGEGSETAAVVTVAAAPVAAYDASPLRKFQKMLSDTLAGDAHLRDGVLRRLLGGQTAEEDGRDASPDQSNDADSTSGYEDACGDTPELEQGFPGEAGAPELPHDDDDGGDDDDDDDDDVDGGDDVDAGRSAVYKCHSSVSGGQGPANGDSCVLS